MQRSAEEVFNEYQQILGDEFGEVFYRLHGYWINTLVALKEFQNMYFEADHPEWLAKISKEFFLFIRSTLWNDVTLRVTRLTDDKCTGRHLNLTIRLLPGYCENDCDLMKLRKKVETL